MTLREVRLTEPVRLKRRWDHFSATIRTSRERRVEENLLIAKADHKDAYKQTPVLLAAVALKSEESGVLRGFVPQTQLIGAMATVAVRWLKIPRLGYCDDFGITAAESAVQDALRAFAALNDILGFEPKVAKLEWGTRIGFLGVIVTFVIVNDKCEAQVSVSPDMG